MIGQVGFSTNNGDRRRIAKITETGRTLDRGMAGADDDGVDLRWAWPQDRSPVQLTSTVTLVGLVITSYTAERFCD